MKPFYSDKSGEIYQGDCLEIMRGMPDESVDCIVTSPPYWGLRDYGTGQWSGGDTACDHAVRKEVKIKSSTLSGGKKTTGHQKEGFKQKCPRCGAKRKDEQIGLESTPEEFVAKLVSVFSQCRRILKKDGTLWLNLGDSYYNYRPGRGQALKKQIVSKTAQDLPQTCARRGNKLEGLKEKDLVGIPWMTAFALRADGWYLRQDIIWAKTNPMPESVQDRCTKSHEYIFLMTKSPQYHFDNFAIQEPVKNIPKRDTIDGMLDEDPTRNKRSVWNVATSPLRDAHFATFPEELIEPCILSSVGGGVVFDPFMGAGTTALVAKKSGRRYIGCELNKKYIAIAARRLAQENLF